MDITNHERRRLLLLSLGNIAVLTAVGLVVVYTSGASLQTYTPPDEALVSKLAIFVPVVFLMFIGFGLKNYVFPFRSAMAALPIGLLLLGLSCGFWSAWEIFHRAPGELHRVLVLKSFRILFSLALAGYAIKWLKDIIQIQPATPDKNLEEEELEENAIPEETKTSGERASAETIASEELPTSTPSQLSAGENAFPPQSLDEKAVPAPATENILKVSPAAKSAGAVEEPDPFFVFPHATAGIFLFFASLYAARFSLPLTFLMIVIGLGLFFRVTWFKNVLTGATYFTLGLIVLSIPSFFNTYIVILIAGIIIFSDALMLFFAPERTKKMMSQVELTSMVIYLACTAFLLWQDGNLVREENFRWRHFVLLTGYLFGGYTVFVTARLLRLFYHRA